MSVVANSKYKDLHVCSQKHRAVSVVANYERKDLHICSQKHRDSECSS